MTYLDALQSTLAAEHASVFVLGYLGGQTSQTAQPQLYSSLRDAYDVHRARRDQVLTRVRDAGGEPVAAASSYDIDPVADATGVSDRALQLERSCGATYGFLVASSLGEQRRWAVDALLDSATRELAFGGDPRAFPGR